MNEHEVAPPFGMWNRISAELEAMPVAATVAPAATSLIPKRAMVGIIAAAMVLGSTMLVGYMVNSSLHNNNQGIGATVKPAAGNTVSQQAQPVKTETTVPVASASPAQPKVTHHAAGNPMQATLQLAQQVKPTINEPVAVVNNTPAENSLAISNATTDVPTPIEPIAQKPELQTYYFPPIDVNTPEKAKTETESPLLTKKPVTTASAGDDDRAGSKFKFRMHNRKKKFTYGNIIR